MSIVRRPDFRHALRTAIAGTAAMFLASYLRLPEAYWAAISAVIVLQATLGAALRDSIVRVGATAVGAAVAIPFLAYWPGSLWGFAIAVFITVVICSMLGLQSGLRLGATTVAVILLVEHHGKPWSPALHRFLEVSFGIVVALVVANIIFPATATEKLRRGIGQGFEMLAQYFIAILDKYRGGDDAKVTELRSRMLALLRSVEELRSQSKYESNLFSSDFELIERMMECESSMFYQMSALDLAARGTIENRFYRELLPEIDGMCDGIEQTLKQFGGVLNDKTATFTRFDFESAQIALSDKNLAVREMKLSQKFTLEEVLHFHTLLVGLENLASEAEQAQPVASAIASGAHRRERRAAVDPSDDSSAAPDIRS